jgi:threonine/homoserine/homoserine lactone efflux protein
MDSWFVAFGLFALSMSASPGPNNVMVTASGANFGFRRTIPHMLGISFGFPVMLLGVGLGAGKILSSHPEFQTALKIIGAVYLVYLAWRICRTAAPTGEKPPGRPMTFIEAAAFQWLNPKAWMIATRALGTYAPMGENLIISLVWMGAIFVTACLPAVVFWTFLGMGFSQLLSSERSRRMFNIAMAGLLLASIILVFI